MNLLEDTLVNISRNGCAIADDREALTPIRQRIEFLENSLREIALFVSAGGYNNDEIPADIVDRIKDGIVALCNTKPTTKTDTTIDR